MISRPFLPFQSKNGALPGAVLKGEKWMKNMSIGISLPDKRK